MSVVAASTPVTLTALAASLPPITRRLAEIEEFLNLGRDDKVFLRLILEDDRTINFPFEGKAQYRIDLT